MRVISLLYHDVVLPGAFARSGFSGADADIYKLTRGEFAEHLQAIADAVDRPPLRVQDVLAGARPALLFTFDDGGVGAIEHTAGLLEERGFPGHFFITVNYIDRPGFLSRQQIRELHRRGHVIGSHSLSHPPRMARLPFAELLREWGESCQVLSDILGEAVTTASVPGGYYARAVARAAARAGVRALFTSEPTARPHTVDGCLVLGRYDVKQGTGAATAAALAAGRIGPRLRQRVLWDAKKVLKAAGGTYWLALRKRILARLQG